MEALIEVLLGFFGELVLEVGAELFAEVGLRLGVGVFRRPATVVAALGYSLLGAGLGAGSVWVAPDPVLHDPVLVALYLVLAPILAGAVMAFVGTVRRRRGDSPIRLDSFGYGWLFAMAFGLARLGFTGG